MVKIITEYGFCYGVTSAIDILLSAGKKYPTVYLTHPLIHNLPENQRLMEESHAVFFQPGMPIDPEGAAVLSAHGHPCEEEKLFLGKCHILDAVCPLISKRYEKAARQEEGITYLYLGKKNHQETLGFLSHFPFYEFLDSNEDLLSQLNHISLMPKTVFFPQTTVSQEKWLLVKQYLEKHSQLVFFMPICSLYAKRSQQAVEETKGLNPQENYFIVCGDQASSNAKEIFAAIKKSNPMLEGTIALNAEALLLSPLKGKNIMIASATSVSKATVEKLKRDLEEALN